MFLMITVIKIILILHKFILVCFLYYLFITSWEQAVRTHPVDKLLEQHCYKSAAGLLQLVRFDVFTTAYLHFALSLYNQPIF